MAQGAENTRQKARMEVSMDHLMEGLIYQVEELWFILGAMRSLWRP